VIHWPSSVGELSEINFAVGAIETFAPPVQVGVHCSISGDGSVFAVGDFFASPDGVKSGTVVAYKRNSSLQWAQIGQTLNGKGQSDFFGYKCTLNYDGSVLAVGAFGSVNEVVTNHGVNPYGNNHGRVEIFSMASSGPWVSKLNIACPNQREAGSYGSSFGKTVALSDDAKTLVVGASGIDYPSAKAVYVYSISSDLTTVALAHTVSGDALLGTTFPRLSPAQIDGMSMDQRSASLTNTIDGEPEVSGINSDGSVILVGVSTVAELKNGSYVSRTPPTPPNAAQYNTTWAGQPTDFTFWGVSSSISGDGNVLAVGTCNLGTEARGAAFVYRWNPTTSTWGLIKEILGTTDYQQLGSSVAVSYNGSILMVAEGQGNPATGSVGVYQLQGEGNHVSKMMHFGVTDAIRVRMSRDGSMVVRPSHIDQNIVVIETKLGSVEPFSGFGVSTVEQATLDNFFQLFLAKFQEKYFPWQADGQYYQVELTDNLVERTDLTPSTQQISLRLNRLRSASASGPFELVGFFELGTVVSVPAPPPAPPSGFGLPSDLLGIDTSAYDPLVPAGGSVVLNLKSALQKVGCRRTGQEFLGVIMAYLEKNKSQTRAASALTEINAVLQSNHANITYAPNNSAPNGGKLSDFLQSCDFPRNAGAWMSENGPLVTFSSAGPTLSNIQAYVDTATCAAPSYQTKESKPLIVCSLKRIVAGYTGPLVRLVKITDQGYKDFGALADGKLDVEAIKTWRGASKCYVSHWYNQVGSGGGATPLVKDCPLPPLHGMVQLPAWTHQAPYHQFRSTLEITNANEPHIAVKDPDLTWAGFMTNNPIADYGFGASAISASFVYNRVYTSQDTNVGFLLGVDTEPNRSELHTGGSAGMKGFKVGQGGYGDPSWAEFKQQLTDPFDGKWHTVSSKWASAIETNKPALAFDGAAFAEATTWASGTGTTDDLNRGNIARFVVGCRTFVGSTMVPPLWQWPLSTVGTVGKLRQVVIFDGRMTDEDHQRLHKLGQW
jgi:hypothetical protein